MARGARDSRGADPIPQPAYPQPRQDEPPAHALAVGEQPLLGGDLALQPLSLRLVAPPHLPDLLAHRGVDARALRVMDTGHRLQFARVADIFSELGVALAQQRIE